MSKGRIALALAALLWAGPALAQGNVEGQITTTRGKAPRGEPVGGILASDSTYKTVRVTNDGYLAVVETDPLSGSTVWNITTGQTTDTTGVYQADSSAILDTRGYRRFFLRVKIFHAGNLAADSLRPVRLAFQFKNIANGQIADTVTTYPWTPIARTPVGGGINTTNTTDSSLAFGAIGRRGTQTPSVVHLVHETSEFVVWLDRIGGAAGKAVYSAYIPISTVYGDQFLSDYTQIRWRVLSSLGIVTTNIALVGYEQ